MNPSRIRVKMCGMTRAEDIAHAVNLGVDAVGLIFYPKSARNVTIKQAMELTKDLPPFVDAVAVLVNPERDFVQELVDELPIQVLQFHGDESPQFCQQFNRPFIKAIHPNAADQVKRNEQEFAQARALLFDTPSDLSRGGTGLTFNWQIIPDDLDKPYLLAGGLNEFNVLDAINACKPYAVDVCSGIEALPGVKDHIKMSRFIKALWGTK